MFKTKTKNKLPFQPKKHHKPFRWRHLALFLMGLLLGVLSTYRSGYLSEPEFDVGSVTPATVKVYHFICGQLMVDGRPTGNDVCDGSVGTGFLISSDGYIATSGHVVTRSAADILVNEAKKNPAILGQLRSVLEIDSNQFIDQSAMNDIFADIYELPESRLNIKNRQDITLISLSDRPVIASSQKEIRQLASRGDTDYIKHAKVVATDYEAKDIVTIEQADNPEGFTASDLAVLKINIANAPYIDLADTSRIKQNAQISLIGFPTDAENQLIANNTIVPTVTNGNISSIRIANGSSSRLFQSDADASQGSSGGPAINQNGESVGIVTYRFKDEVEANSAKSYIRDIQDLKTLLDKNSIILNKSASAQDTWQDGLDLASQNKFSQALEKYNHTISLYPAHRLANIYSNQAIQAIESGQDVKDPNYIAITAGIGGGGALAVATASGLAMRHHSHHRAYRRLHQHERKIVSPNK